jgi:hypothetical protein
MMGSDPLERYFSAKNTKDFKKNYFFIFSQYWKIGPDGRLDTKIDQIGLRKYDICQVGQSWCPNDHLDNSNHTRSSYFA